MFNNGQIEELRNYFQAVPESGDKLPNPKDVPDWTHFYLKYGKTYIEYIMFKNVWYKKVSDSENQIVFDNVQNTGFEDLRFPATAINPAGTPAPMEFDTTNLGFLADATGTELIGIIAQMPHSWKIGSDIEPHIHWMPTTTNTGTVLWRMEYKWTNLGDADSGSWTSVDVTQAGGGVAYKHQIASFGYISGAGKTLSSLISIKISRIGASDTYTADALLKEFDIHYEIDSSGSKELYEK